MDDAQVHATSASTVSNCLVAAVSCRRISALNYFTQIRPDSIYNRDYNAPTEAEKTLGDVSALPAPMQASSCLQSCCSCHIDGSHRLILLSVTTRKMGQNRANKMDASFKRGHDVQEVGRLQDVNCFKRIRSARVASRGVSNASLQRFRADVGCEGGG
jgi:hypothetical protein